MTSRWLVCALVVLGACYDVPRPECGFACGTNGACPEDYSCLASDNSCRLNGSPLTEPCQDFLPPDTSGAPTIRPGSMHPSPDATDVAATEMVYFAFSEEVSGVDPSTVHLVNTLTGDDVMADLTSGATTVNVFLTPHAVLAPGVTYRVMIEAGIFDVSGEPFVPTDWSFTTDGTAPTVVSRAPAPDETNVSVATDVSVTFSESVNVDTSNFRLEHDGIPTAGQLAFAFETPDVMLRPLDQLLANTTYTVFLDDTIHDASLNPLAATSWTFTTGADTSRPKPAMVSPSSLFQVPVDSQVWWQFNEDVVGADGTTVTLTMNGQPVAASVTYDAATRTAKLKSTVQLAELSTYEARLVPPIADTAGNTVAPLAVAFSTAADTLPPRVSTFTPHDGADDVPATAVIVVTFNEGVQSVDAASFIVTSSDGTTSTPVAGTYASSDAGRTWTFTPTAPFAASADIAVAIRGGLTDTSVALNHLTIQRDAYFTISP